jgi:hypothetical protein
MLVVVVPAMLVVVIPAMPVVVSPAMPVVVIPAKAGIQGIFRARRGLDAGFRRHRRGKARDWMPAFAGMTGEGARKWMPAFAGMTVDTPAKAGMTVDTSI